MNRGDLVAFYPRSIIERIIARYDGKYCHIGICIGNKQILSMTRYGVDIKQITEYKNRYDVFSIDTDKQNELIKFLLSLTPVSKYDYSGIVSIVFPFVRQSSRRFYCSEFITLGLYYIGLLPEKLQLTPLELVNEYFITKYTL